MESPTAVAGRIAWRRYAMIFAPAIVVAGMVVVLSSRGAVAASFAISGAPFKLSADALDGTGFVSYTSVDTGTDGKHHAVTPSGFASARLTNLCQSVVTPTPFGPVTMRLTAGKTAPVKASNLVADFDQLSGNLQFNGYSSGVDAAQLSGATTGPRGGWGQQAKSVHIAHLHQHSLATTAATFLLTGLTIDVSFGTHECY